MVRYNEQDKQRVYVVRSTVEEVQMGSWTDCTTIYNNLSGQNRSQDGLSSVYKKLDKADMESITRTPEWEATRQQVRQELFSVSFLRDARVWLTEQKVASPQDNPLRSRGRFEDSQPASPAPIYAWPCPVQMWEQAMSIGPGDGGAVLPEATCWFEDIDVPAEQSLGVNSSSSRSATTCCTAATVSAELLFGSSAGGYNGGTNGWSDASCTSQSLGVWSTEGLEDPAVSAHGFPTMQALTQPTAFMWNNDTVVAAFDQSFAEAAWRATTMYESDVGRPAVYSTAAGPFMYADTSTSEGTDSVTISHAYVDRHEPALPDSPTLGMYQGTELEQRAGCTTSDSSQHQTPHFSDFPNLSAEAMGHIDMLAWDHTQISLSLEGLETLLVEEESDSSVM